MKMLITRICVWKSIFQNFIFGILILISINSYAEELSAENKNPKTLLVFEGKHGLIKISINSTTPYSYEYINHSKERVEYVYGVVDINHSANMRLSSQEREKIQNFSELKIGDKLKFSFDGNSGAGNWTRTAQMTVISQEKVEFKGKEYLTKLIQGSVSAPGFYDSKFQCLYLIEFKVCLKTETDTYSRRNSSLNGLNSIKLIDIIFN